MTTGAWGRKSRHPLQHYHGPKALGLGQAPSPSSVGPAPTHFPPSVGRQQSKRCSPARPTPTAATPSTACSMLHAAGPLFKTPGAGGLGPPSPCVGLQEGLDPKDHFPKKKESSGPTPTVPTPRSPGLWTGTAATHPGGQAENTQKPVWKGGPTQKWLDESWGQTSGGRRGLRCCRGFRSAEGRVGEGIFLTSGRGNPTHPGASPGGRGVWGSHFLGVNLG